VASPRGPADRVGPLSEEKKSLNSITSERTFAKLHGEPDSPAPDSAPSAPSAPSATGPSAPPAPGPPAPSGPGRAAAGPAVWIATVGGVGFGPWAPGTWGSLLAGVVFCLGLHRLDAALYGLCLVGLAGLGVWASTAAERYFGRHDDGRIVIDEFVGQLIALFPLVLLHEVSLGGLRIPGLESTPARNIDFWWMLVVTGFVAFRWFDIRKPGPVKWAEERFERGAGVMADDIVAGFLAAIVVMFPAYVLVAIRFPPCRARCTRRFNFAVKFLVNGPRRSEIFPEFRACLRRGRARAVG